VTSDEAHVDLLQQEVALRRAACEQLRARLDACRQEKEATQKSCLGGLEAAQAQMSRMREELQRLRQNSQEEGAGEMPARVMDEDEARSLRERRQLEARSLRYELTKWKHRASILESHRPREEAEVAQLKAELLHAQDVLESTRHAVRHLEVETAQAADKDVVPLEERLKLDKNGLPVGEAKKQGKGNVQAWAERQVREKAEETGHKLSMKARRLSSVVLAQHLLVQRLEKQVLKEEGLLEQQEQRLAGESKLHLRLRVALRQRSDEIVVEKVLGKTIQRPKQKDVHELDGQPEIESKVSA